MVIYATRIFRGRAAAFWGGAYVVVFLALITPWLIRNHQVSGSFLGLARFDLIDRTGTFQGETLQRSYHPELKDAFSLRGIISKFLVNARTNLVTNFRLIGSDFLVFFFTVGLLYGFRRQETSRLRRVLVGLIVCAIFGMSLIGSDPERIGPDVFGSNLLVLFLPLVAIFGVAFFYLLLDRIPFTTKLTRGAAIGGFVLLNISPMIFTMLPPRHSAFPYPPYLPMVQAVAGGGGFTGVGVNALLGQFKKQTSLDLRQDVLGWMGDAGVFVGGTTSADLGGALVIKTTDPAKTKRTLAVLKRYARQSAGTKVTSLKGSGIDDGFTAQDPTGPAVHVALAGDRFVVAVGGKDVLAQAISPGQKLGSSPAFTAAAGKLGNGLRPSFYLDFTQVTKLLETFAGTDADFQKAKPYLDTFGAIVAGAKSEGSGVTRSRFVVTLR